MRDRSPADKTPDYANFDPIMAKGEELHFGVEGSQRDAFLRKMRPIVDALDKAGFAKPAAISRELNRQKKRTFRGEFWSPRLCWFLKKELYSLRQRERKPRPNHRPPKNREQPNTQTVGGAGKLTATELERRRIALQAHLNQAARDEKS